MTLTRWEGKPTSGRYVYASREFPSGRLTGGWQWQCDLCGEDECVAYGYAASMQEAFAQALEHTKVCLFRNRKAAA